MKRFAACLCVSVPLWLILSGCTTTIKKLPPIDAASFDYVRHDPLGGTKIHAENIKVNDPKTGSLTADVVSWDTSYPTWGVSIKAVGYSQGVKQSPAAAPAAKP